MSEFHRIVTYLYLYEHNQKTHNVGYAKIEKRDTQCRVEIHMKNTGSIAKDIPVYFYTQDNTRFSGILLGSVAFNHGTGEFKKLLDSNNLLNSGYPISRVKGIFLPLSDEEMILSQWDDDIFQRAAFSPLKEPVSSKIISLEDSMDSNNKSEADNNKPLNHTSDSNSPAGSTSEENLNNTLSSSDTSHLQAAEAAPDVSFEKDSSSGPRLDFIMENFTAASPFSSEDSFHWVKLELKDLRLFPSSYWHLGNNSFLLHGFFNYHHLILGRNGEGSSCKYILGVPGVFQNPERVMATIFGFPEFRSTSQDAHKLGQFGYWLRPLN